MKPSRSLLIWCLLTTGMIFAYIYHQNIHIKNTYQRQRLENTIQATEKIVMELEQALARQTIPEQLTKAAETLGMRKTKISQLHSLKQHHE